ncbi:DUF429 domain-containing protein [Dongia deserti]|uniref:DUF429 domain-containing protein n=1 Tax=Dongia deserti TaxID=2268030 RepID=UPI000E64C948|nr:DUF429 domain-containing protein [Dongia deserti]
MTRILGVDFSGASDAGRKIWIAEGRLSESGALELIYCVPAMSLPGGGVRPEVAVPALARHVAALDNARVGCDFPFSLPRDLVTVRTWKSFALRYAAEFADAESFRSMMRSRHNGVEYKRMTDRIAGTPFNSYNLRLYRQTWWGITGLLGPLVRAGRAIVRPQQKLDAGKPTLIEVCAACTLKSIDMYAAYKGERPAHRRARKRILDHFIDRGALVAPARRMRQLLLDNEGGDALDAVIGAVATARANLIQEADAFQRLEGRVYFEIGV